jgi:hypothetical protein
MDEKLMHIIGELRVSTPGGPGWHDCIQALLDHATGNSTPRKEASRDETQLCPKCGSVDCQMLAWVRVNGSDLVPDADPPSDEVYCPKCNVTFHYAELKEG